MLTTGAASSGSRAGARLATPAGVVAIVLAYAAAHMTARLLASRNLGEDDPYENIFSQVLRLGYEADQPALYNWVLWVVQQVTGPTIVSFLAIKYVLLVGIALLLFLVARRILGDPLWALMCVESMALMYQTAWRFHEGFTHTVGTICAVVATFWAVLRVLEDRRPAGYLLLGIVAGLGLLTHFKFVFFLAALAFAACLQAAIRRAIEPRLLLMSTLIAAAIAAPSYYWALVEGGGLSQLLATAPGRVHLTHFARMLEGLRDAVIRPAYCLLPLIVCLIAIFPAILTEVRTLSARQRGDSPDLVLLVAHYLVIVWAFLVVAAIVFGFGDYPSHRLFPLLLIAVVWLMHLARKACRSPIQIRLFAGFVLAFLVFAFAVRLLNMFVQEPYCTVCRWGVPYEGLARTIENAGFSQGTIVTAEPGIGGNLRRFFPKARLVSSQRPVFVPPTSKKPRNGKTVAVWSEGFPSTEAIRLAAPYLPAGAPAPPATVRIAEIPWRHAVRPAGYRRSTWYFMILSNETDSQPR